MNAGSAVSYVDFNQFRLYDPITRVVIGTADLPGNGFKPTVTATDDKKTTASTSTPSIVGSSASKVALGGLGILGAAMMLF